MTTFYRGTRITHRSQKDDLVYWRMLYYSFAGLLMLYSLYMFYHYIIYFIASHRLHRLIPPHLTHVAPHFISTPNLTCFEFPALPGWACALEFNKHSYGSHLCLFLYLHSTVVVHCPVPEKDLQPCIFMRATLTNILAHADSYQGLTRTPLQLLLVSYIVYTLFYSSQSWNM